MPRTRPYGTMYNSATAPVVDCGDNNAGQRVRVVSEGGREVGESELDNQKYAKVIEPVS
jgi:hypothetical protein